MSESNDLATYIVNFLNDKGWHVYRTNAGQIKKGGYMIRLAPKGTGDVTGWSDEGRYVHIEGKVPPDTATPEQIAELWAVYKSRHGICCVATSKEQFDMWYRTNEPKGFYRGAYERQTNFDTDNAGDSGGGE